MTRVLAVVGSVSPPGRLHAAIATAVEIAAGRTGVTASLLDHARSRSSRTTRPPSSRV